MMKTSLKDIRSLVAEGIAEDITNAPASKFPIHFDRIAYSVGSCGITGCLVRERETGKLFAVTARSTSLYWVL